MSRGMNYPHRCAVPQRPKFFFFFFHGCDSRVLHLATGDSETEGLDIEKLVPQICGEISQLRTMCHFHLELAKWLLDTGYIG